MNPWVAPVILCACLLLPISGRAREGFGDLPSQDLFGPPPAGSLAPAHDAHPAGPAEPTWPAQGPASRSADSLGVVEELARDAALAAGVAAGLVGPESIADAAEMLGGVGSDDSGHGHGHGHGQ